MKKKFLLSLVAIAFAGIAAMAFTSNSSDSANSCEDRRCGACYGTGVCKVCNGYGTISDGFGLGQKRTCTACSGSGKCSTCGGSGRR